MWSSWPFNRTTSANPLPTNCSFYSCGLLLIILIISEKIIKSPTRAYHLSFVPRRKEAHNNDHWKFMYLLFFRALCFVFSKTMWGFIVSIPTVVSVDGPDFLESAFITESYIINKMLVFSYYMLHFITKLHLTVWTFISCTCTLSWAELVLLYCTIFDSNMCEIWKFSATYLVEDWGFSKYSATNSNFTYSSQSMVFLNVCILNWSSDPVLL